jgi:hypothetical protein
MIANTPLDKICDKYKLKKVLVIFLVDTENNDELE